MITINSNIFNNYRYNTMAFKARRKQEPQKPNQENTIEFFEKLLQKIDIKKIKSGAEDVLNIIDKMTDMENSKFARAPKKQAFKEKEITPDYILSYSADNTFRRAFDYRAKDYSYIHVNEDAILTYFNDEISPFDKKNATVYIKGNKFKYIQKINDDKGDEISYIYEIDISDKKIKSMLIKGYVPKDENFPIYATVYFKDNMPKSMETVALKPDSMDVCKEYYTIEDLKLSPVNF